MKNLLFTISALIILSLNTSCQTGAPQNVTSTFNEKFPTAENVAWEQEDENEWEASFEMDGKSMEAAFDGSGEWLETEWEIDVEDISPEVFKTLYLKYEEFEIEEVDQIESPGFNGFELNIEAEEDDEEVEFEVLIGADGTFVKAEMEDEDDDEDEDEDDDTDEDDEDGEEAGEEDDD